MKATSIPKHEASFFNTGVDNGGKIFDVKKATPISYPGGKLDFYTCHQKNGDESYFYKESIKKKNIVLHFTMGWLKGDIDVLTKYDFHVSVPFIIPRNGNILNMWSSKYWSYHLGTGTVGGNKNNSSRTIGIELSNIGPLYLNGNNLVNHYDRSDVYCSLEETGFYQKLDTPYRGIEYFATFTKKQYDSLISLLKYLTHKYDIEVDFLPESKRYKTLNEQEIENFDGILSHVNYRPTGKLDIGPAFNWDYVIQNL